MASPAKKPFLPHQEGAAKREYKKVADIKKKALRERVSELAAALAEASRNESLYKAAVQELKEQLEPAMKEAGIQFLEHAQFKFYPMTGSYKSIDEQTLKTALLKRKVHPDTIQEAVEEARIEKPWTALAASDMTKRKQ